MLSVLIFGGLISFGTMRQYLSCRAKNYHWLGYSAELDGYLCAAVGNLTPVSHCLFAATGGVDINIAITTVSSFINMLHWLLTAVFMMPVHIAPITLPAPLPTTQSQSTTPGRNFSAEHGGKAGMYRR